MTERITPDRDEFDRGPLSRTKHDDWCFTAAGELRDSVVALTEELREAAEWSMSPGEFDNLFIGTFARGTKTYQAAVLLCHRGYGEQAAMLNRSLFEDMVTAWWMSLQADGDALMEAMQRHHDHARVLYERACELHHELGLTPDEDAEPLGKDYIAELDTEFGRYGGQWHGKRLDELVREVEQGWSEDYPGLLWKFFRFVNHWNNYLLHHSSVGLVEGVRWRSPEERPALVLGPSHAWATASLWAAFWSYGLLVLCTLRRLSPNRAGGFKERLEELSYRFHTVTREQARDIGRNDSCPCQSGKKFKHCHEAYVE